MVDRGELTSAAQFYGSVFRLRQQPSRGGPPGTPEHLVLRGAHLTLTLITLGRDSSGLYRPDQQPWPAPDLLARPRTEWN